LVLLTDKSFVNYFYTIHNIWCLVPSYGLHGIEKIKGKDVALSFRVANGSVQCKGHLVSDFLKAFHLMCVKDNYSYQQVLKFYCNVQNLWICDYSSNGCFSRQTMYPVLSHHPFYVPNINSVLFG